MSPRLHDPEHEHANAPDEAPNRTRTREGLNNLHRRTNRVQRERDEDTDRERTQPVTLPPPGAPAIPPEILQADAVRMSPRTITRNAAISAVGGAATGAALMAALASAGITGGASLAPLIAAGAINGSLSGLWTYFWGEAHNSVWRDPTKERPGLLGTYLRGIFGPLTTALGVVRNLTWHRS